MERICAQYEFIFLLTQKNNIRIQRSQASMGFAKGKARFPFALFWFLLQEQKKRPGGEPYKLSDNQDPPRRQAPTNQAQYKSPQKETAGFSPAAPYSFPFYSMPVSCLVMRSQPM